MYYWAVECCSWCANSSLHLSVIVFYTRHLGDPFRIMTYTCLEICKRELWNGKFIVLRSSRIFLQIIFFLPFFSFLIFFFSNAYLSTLVLESAYFWANSISLSLLKSGCLSLVWMTRLSTLRRWTLVKYTKILIHINRYTNYIYQNAVTKKVFRKSRPISLHTETFSVS